MEELLAPISTSYRRSNNLSEDLLVEAKKSPLTLTSNRQPSTPEEALEVLRSEPDLDTLRSTLKYLIQDAPSSSNLRITHVSPIAAQLINIISSEIVPNYWAILNETSSTAGRKTLKYGVERKLLLSCLRSLSGLNAILGRISFLIRQIKEVRKEDRGPGSIQVLRIQLDVLEILLHGENVIAQLWHDLDNEVSAKQRAVWNEVIALVGGGKILNVAAEATSVIRDATKEITEPKWIAHGMQYSRWLARNIIHWSRGLPSTAEGPWKPLSELFSKGLRLGHPGMSGITTKWLYL
jgi:telomere length regulation protein